MPKVKARRLETMLSNRTNPKVFPLNLRQANKQTETLKMVFNLKIKRPISVCTGTGLQKVLHA
jgi:hypothetical protein